MKKVIMLLGTIALLGPLRPAFAFSIGSDLPKPPQYAALGTVSGTATPTPTPPLPSITDQFSTSFLSHVSAVEDFRQDGSHVIKFTDGIFQMIPYKGDHLLLASFGLIPNPQDAAKFFKSYAIHAHLVSIIGKYLDINPTYAPILNDLELTPGYTYDTDVHHGQLDFCIGYTHKFGQ